MVSTARLSVVFIAGPGRTGSTILGNVLNEVEGCFHVGELRDLWRILALGLPNPCGCGLPLTECPVWSRVLERVVPERRELKDYAAEVWGLQRSSVRTAQLQRLLQDRLDGGARAYAEVMGGVYQAVADVTGSDIIVDSSKAPAEAAAMLHAPGVVGYVVTLIRDPRAVAHAWSRTNAHLIRQPLFRSSTNWMVQCVGAEWVAAKAPGSIRIRNEDLIADPEATVGRLLAGVAAGDRANPVSDRSVTLHGNHTVAGNPGRERTGVIALEPDQRWVRGMSRPRQLLVGAWTLPLRIRYRY
jgi:hypothetical protein